MQEEGQAGECARGSACEHGSCLEQVPGPLAGVGKVCMASGCIRQASGLPDVPAPLPASGAPSAITGALTTYDL